MKYLIGIDIGTSSAKGVLMTTDGQVVDSAKATFQYQTQENGAVELEPKEYLASCFQAIKELAAKAKDGTILGICASSASGNLILLDRENKPLTNIISWQDKRVAEEARELLPDLNDAEFYRQIGWPFGYKIFPLAQLCYMKKHKPELIENCSMAAMSTEYLYHALTGKWGISTSAGTTFFLIDQEKKTYIQPLLTTLGISESQLPPIMDCGVVLGNVQEEVTKQCGLPKGTPVVLGSFDHPSAARGVGVLQEGELLLSCGTSWVAFFPIKDRDKGIGARTLVDPFLTPNGCYGVMSSVASLSGRLKLYVNRYIDDSHQAFNKLSELARKSQPGANGLQINPLDEPDDDNIKAYSKEDIARAIMEGTVELLRQKLELLAEKGISAKTAVMVGGPSEDPYWIELIENMCNISVKVIHGAYAGAVGAAVIAGIGIGEYENEEMAHKRFQENERGDASCSI